MTEKEIKEIVQEMPDFIKEVLLLTLLKYKSLSDPTASIIHDFMGAVLEKDEPRMLFILKQLAYGTPKESLN